LSWGGGGGGKRQVGFEKGRRHQNPRGEKQIYRPPRTRGTGPSKIGENKNTNGANPVEIWKKKNRKGNQEKKKKKTQTFPWSRFLHGEKKVKGSKAPTPVRLPKEGGLGVT